MGLRGPERPKGEIFREAGFGPGTPSFIDGEGIQGRSQWRPIAFEVRFFGTMSAAEICQR